MASVQRREVLKAEALSGRPETLGETQSFFHLLDNAEGEEAAQIRRRLSARLRQLIEDVWVLVECVGYNKRAVHIQVNLRSGGSRWDRRYSPDVPEERDNPPCLDLFGVDLREVDPRVLSGLLETGEH